MVHTAKAMTDLRFIVVFYKLNMLIVILEFGDNTVISNKVKCELKPYSCHELMFSWTKGTYLFWAAQTNSLLGL